MFDYIWQRFNHLINIYPKYLANVCQVSKQIFEETKCLPNFVFKCLLNVWVPNVLCENKLANVFEISKITNVRHISAIDNVRQSNEKDNMCCLNIC